MYRLNCRSFRGRAYHDARTWRLRTLRLHANWAPRLQEMYEAYLKWKYNTPETSATTTAPNPSSSESHEPERQASIDEHLSDAGASDTLVPEVKHTSADLPRTPSPISYNFEIEVLDIYTLDNFVTIERSAESRSVAEALMLHGYVANAPETPTLAFSVRTLELFRFIRQRKPSFSVEAFTKVICDIYNVCDF